MTLRLKDRFSIVKGLLYLTLGICCVYLIVTGRYLNYIRTALRAFTRN